MKNQCLLDEEEGSGGNDPGPPAAKRARTSGVTLDSEEAAFAGSLPPLHPNQAAVSQYRNVEKEVEDDDGVGVGVGDGDGEDPGDADIDLGDERGGNGEGEQEVEGFQDNGICF